MTIPARCRNSESVNSLKVDEKTQSLLPCLYFHLASTYFRIGPSLFRLQVACQARPERGKWLARLDAGDEAHDYFQAFRARLGCGLVF
jgi:hypothetical protein